MASETALATSQRRAVLLGGGVRATVALLSRRLARLAFGATIVLSPLDSAIVLVARHHPSVYAGYTDLLLPASEIALLATLGLWALSLVANPRPVSLGPRFLRWPLTALLFLIWLGVPFSIDPSLSAFNAAQFLLMAALAVYALNEIHSIASLALPLGLMVGIESVVGIGQFVAQRSVGLGWAGELSLDPSQNGVSVVAASGTARLLRAYGLSGHPNILGGLLAFGLILLFFAAWRIRGRRSVVVGVVVAAGLVALLSTFSRAAWLAAAIGLGVGLAMLFASHLPGREAVRLPALRVARRWLLVSAGIGVLAAVVLVAYGPYVGVRLGLGGGSSVTEEMSLGERVILANGGWSIATGHLLLGTGLATFPIALVNLDPSLTFSYQPAHMVLLDVAAEAGVFAAVSYLAVMIAPWLALLRTRSTWTLDLIAASAALAAVTVVGLLDYYTWTFTPGRIWAWLVIGLWAGAYARSREARSDAA